MDLIALENLKRYYGNQLALAAGSVVMPLGAVGLLGPNGAGKSTLLKILMGLLAPSSGRARLLGLDVVRNSLAVRSRVGYLSETECVVPGLSAVEFVALAGELSGMVRKDAHRRAHEVLAQLGVEESRYRRLEELSTGVKQRVRLAQALVHDPEILILDEPTNGLDPSGRKAMLDLVRSLSRDFGKSVIVSSHLLDDVDRVCDSVIILDRGHVLAHGRIDVLRVRIPNRYRVRLSGNGEGFLRRLRAAGAKAVEDSRPGAGEIELSIELYGDLRPRALLECLRDAAREAGGPASDDAPVLRSLVPEEEKLQDIFRRIVGSGEAEGAA